MTALPIWVTEVGVSSFGAEEVQRWGLGRTAEGLGRNEDQLKDLVTNFNTTMAATASQASNLRASIHVLGPTLHFKGELYGEEDLEFQGQLEGSIEHTRSLSIGKDGGVTGNIRAKFVIVEGRVDGDIYASESVSVRQSARVKGNIYARVERALMNDTDLFLFESAFARDTYQRTIGTPKGLVRCVFNGVTAWGDTSEQCEANSLEIIRTAERFLAERARGCVCPPDFPVCVCGREPEAELLTQRAVAATPGELAQNPRAKSGRLRAARKIVSPSRMSISRSTA